MPTLNAMFPSLSNAMCTNGAFIGWTIRNMDKDVHASTARLYLAAKQLIQVQGKSNIARLLDESPQVVNNWETRGVSEKGALKAQAVIGCDANWLLYGEGGMQPGWPFKHASLQGFLSLGLEDRARVDGKLEEWIEALSHPPSPEDLKSFERNTVKPAKKTARRKAA